MRRSHVSGRKSAPRVVIGWPLWSPNSHSGEGGCSTLRCYNFWLLHYESQIPVTSVRLSLQGTRLDCSEITGFFMTIDATNLTEETVRMKALSKRVILSH